MKTIDVAEKIGTVLLSEGSGKDLFIAVLEEFLEGDRDDDIELNFLEVLTLGPDAMNAFVETAIESKQLSLEILKTRLHFSGLLITDIDTVSKAFSPERNKAVAERQSNFEELTKKMADSMKGMNKDMPLSKVFEAIQGNGGGITTEGLEATMKQIDVLLKGFNRK